MIKIDVNDRQNNCLLTAHRGGRPEDLSDLRVHLDHYILLHGDFLVASLDLLVDPLIEWSSYDRCNYITNPLLRRFGQLNFRIGKIFEHVPVIII
jgi:hypothetical protein